MRHILPLLLLLIAGCVKQPTLYPVVHPIEVPASVCIDDEGIDSHQIVLEVMSAINQRLRFEAFQPATFDSGCDVRIDPHRADNAGGHFAWVGDVCVIGMSNAYGSERFYVIQHELLHCLGLMHDSVTGSIMYPSQPVDDTEHGPYLTPTIMDNDRRALRERFQ